ncbi:DUF3732 domain-containing protein [Sphingomonas sp. NIBR02145]|uniref:DUF3732 domain-containing protein n=1 Tax=Sphingomonas sp. NIBR02145 TaxID=3014784 RepID=UPI0022B3B14F|nr:DUF3732 domain-containing protein [Sphingomonas sp. NIBR02145]WHU03662.1 DUF3732 domain-containing protein [Sphingomonas sp. NIBR02145]
MKLEIRELIIWPDNPALTPRTLAFATDGISVITGWSSTGKSAITAIIDYVLGAGKCAIPVGVIREKAAWYGLTLETAIGPIRLARRRPDGRQVSDQYWLQQGSDVELGIGAPHANANTDRVKLLFDDLSGLSNLTLDPEKKSFGGRASFRDMAAFNFLPQHIVANPHTLFFKTDSSEHREKLRSVLPLALGIITNDDLVRRHTLHMLRQEHRRLEAELRIRRNGLETWRANATGAFFRAQELGLLAAGDPPANLRSLLERLQDMVDNTEAVGGATGRTAEATRRLETLRAQEQAASRAVSDTRRRLKRLRSLHSSASAYGAALRDQAGRVQGAGWFRKAIDNESCVLCGSDSDPARQNLEELGEAISELETLSVGTRQTLPIVDREIVALEKSVIEQERNLITVRRTRQAAEAAAEAEQGRGQTLEAVYRFIGSTEQALAMLGDVEGETGLSAQIADLAGRIRRLEEDLNEGQRVVRQEEVSNKISSYVGRFVDSLAVGGAEGQPALDFRELNLRFDREGANKPDYLWEIGSGENWMAYHLATLLALHGVFLQREPLSPVPTFLVIDQPTQVYFPSDSFDDAIAAGVEADLPEQADAVVDDLARTKRIFAALARAHSSFEGKLQIIVVDHADQHAWQEHSNIKEVANWRGDKDYLIPRAWLTDD